MTPFCRLHQALDESRSTGAKLRLLGEYFTAVDPHDGAWAVFFLSGRRLKRLVAPSELRATLLELTGMPSWLLEETYASVGDLAETLALLVEADPAVGSAVVAGEGALPLHVWVEQRLLPLRGQSVEARRSQLSRWWLSLPLAERFLLNKLLIGALRVGVSRRLVIRALADAGGVDVALIAHRMMGQWQPGAAFFSGLFTAQTSAEGRSRPYPFFLASPMTGHPRQLGLAEAWLAEWKWDGIRAQVAWRAGRCAVWSRGEDLLEGRFPEIEAAAEALPEGVVLDGEIIARQDRQPLPFQTLQRRIQCLRPGARLLREAPAVFLAYDLLEASGQDLRGQPLWWRRRHLQRVLASAPDAIDFSPELPITCWDACGRLREAAREQGAEGIMLKRRDSVYRAGRVRGDWWKWKLAARTIDAILLYAQPGHGRRADLCTDYTFGIRTETGLVPIAKACNGLAQADREALDRWIRANTVERFGPVRVVREEQVFELAFDGIAESRRHKSGLSLRCPRIARWRQDLAPDQADTIERLRELLT
jgi:DNA ligase 1